MPHICVPVGQVATQLEPEQSPPAHVMLQSPQPPPCCAKVPGRQAHAPPMQYCEAMHIAQLVPQCSGSEVTSAQVAPHICDPAAVQVHWPLTHCSPLWH